MKKIINLKNKTDILYFVILTILAIVAMCMRCFFSIITTDEVFNIGQVYRTVLGQKFMLENWDFFQVGDSLSYPFIWLYYKFTGSSEGIVLYSRLCSVFITFAIALISYILLKSIFEKKLAFATCLIYYTTIPFNLSLYWYDNWSLTFLLLNCLMIIYGINKGKLFPWFFLSGSFQAIAVYCYPTIVAVFLYEFIMIFIFLNSQKKRLSFKNPEIIYAAGAAFIFFVFVLFCLSRDWHDFFIFNKQITSANLSDRSYSLKGLMSSLQLLVIKTFRYFKLELCLSLLFLSICIFVKRNIISKIIIPIYILITIFFQLFYYFNFSSTPGVISQGQNYILFYLTLCALFLYLFFFRHNILFKNFFIFLYIPAILSGIIYAFTGMNGAIKFTFGCRFGSILFFLELFQIITQSDISDKNNAHNVYNIVISFFLIFNTVLIFVGSFQSDSPIKMYRNNTNICYSRTGIYKYIYDYQDKVIYINNFEKDLKSVIKNDDKTILCGRGLIYGYLMTDLKPDTNYLWQPGSLTGESSDSGFYDILFQYFNSYYGFPDIIVLKKDEFEFKNKELMDFINQNYDIEINNSDEIFYHIK